MRLMAPPATARPAHESSWSRMRTPADGPPPDWALLWNTEGLLKTLKRLWPLSTLRLTNALTSCTGTPKAATTRNSLRALAFNSANAPSRMSTGDIGWMPSGGVPRRPSYGSGGGVHHACAGGGGPYRP